jgi:hypothetical protein
LLDANQQGTAKEKQIKQQKKVTTVLAGLVG